MLDVITENPRRIIESGLMLVMFLIVTKVLCKDLRGPYEDINWKILIWFIPFLYFFFSFMTGDWLWLKDDAGNSIPLPWGVRADW